MTNTKKEKNLEGKIINGKDEYSANIGSQISLDNPKKLQLTPYLVIKSPSRDLLTFSGSGLYTAGKILKGNVKFDAVNMSPINADGQLNDTHVYI